MYEPPPHPSFVSHIFPPPIPFSYCPVHSRGSPPYFFGNRAFSVHCRIILAENSTFIVKPSKAPPPPLAEGLGPPPIFPPLQAFPKPSAYLTKLCLVVFCKFFGDFWVCLGRDSFSQRISKIWRNRNIKDLM